MAGGATGTPGGMGMGMMEGMKNRMGGQELEELYPQLMALPDMTPEQRTKLKEQAHQRMRDGAALLSEGLGDLSAVAAGDDFKAMQDATAKLREGLAQFETGLATHRAIEEGAAPRNEALQWFKRELNLLPPATEGASLRFLGMAPFHLALCSLLIVFMAVMIWMHSLRMRRVSALLEKLAAAGPSTAAIPSSTTCSTPDEPAEKGDTLDIDRPAKAAETTETEEATETAEATATAEPAETEEAAETAETGPIMTFQTSGKSIRFLPDETVLEASKRAGVSIDNACGMGVCGLCLVKLLSGEVTMAVEEGLRPDDKAAGMVLACEAKPKGDVTIEA